MEYSFISNAIKRQIALKLYGTVPVFLSTREHGDTEGLDSEVCCSADKSKCICFSLKNSILETNVSATDVAGI
jgi:hypothetical protein